MEGENRLKHVIGVVLAAGEGTRMHLDHSKMLHTLNGQILVKFAADACLKCGMQKVIVVVGYQAEKVKSYLGDNFEYVCQEKRRGTGDALRRAASLLENFEGELVVLPGDAPFITCSVLRRLVEYHRKKNSSATVLTAVLPNPDSYGRIIRNGFSSIRKIVESKVATPAELKIREVNSGVYCFNTSTVLPLLFHIPRNPVSGEYYLTDLIEILNERELRVEALRTEDPRLVLGVNTPEDLREAWEIMKKDKGISSP